jgi:hypothetical protein
MRVAVTQYRRVGFATLSKPKPWMYPTHSKEDQVMSTSDLFKWFDDAPGLMIEPI